MSVQPNLMLNYSEVVRLAPIHTFFWEDKSATQGSERMCVFSVSRHFFKTNVTQSIAELILYSHFGGHFLSNLVNLDIRM